MPQTKSKSTKPHDTSPHIYQPRVFVTLNPQNHTLSVELPGPNGRRLVPIHSLETLKTVLIEQQNIKAFENRKPKIGEPGAPTTDQVLHWEQHQDRRFSDKIHSSCAHCRDEARHERVTKRYDSRGQLITNDKPKPKPTKSRKQRPTIDVDY